MTEAQWTAFCTYRDSFKKNCTLWNEWAEHLYPLQQDAAKKDTPEYPVETAVVYNTAYDSVTINDEIRLIVIGDNPGKEEQLAINRKYLVGQSGRIADGFFQRNSELQIDFRKNAVIVNKTPVHTAKTTHLRYLQKHGGEKICTLIFQSQVTMAQAAANLHQSLIHGARSAQSVPQLWLVGYSELKGRGLFIPYRDSFKAAYKNPSGTMNSAWNEVYVYQHFSMNRFLVDLNQFQAAHPDCTLLQALQMLGHQHRDEIFGQS